MYLTIHERTHIHSGEAGVEIEVTLEMIEAGIAALLEFGCREDFEATDSSFIVREIFSAMQRVACPVPAPTA